MRCTLRSGCAFTTAIAVSATAAQGGMILYDATAGTLPAAQGWLYGTNPIFGSEATQTVGGGILTLDTTADRSEQAGYFSALPPIPGQHPGLPVMDPSIGYTVRFGLQVESEGHNQRDDNSDGIDDRAGYSVIVVSENLEAIEIAFWEDEVWAYDDDSVNAIDLFTHAEGAAYDTTEALTTFAITVQGDMYTVRANGAPLFGGMMRDYSAFAGTPDPYEIPSFLFFGDDTSSADSRTRVSFIEIIIPEPGATALAAMAGAVLLRRRR